MDGDEQPADDQPVDERPVDERPVDESEGLPLPASEEQARRQPHSPEEEAKADEVGRDTTVAGATEIGGRRFFGADPPA